MKIKKTNNNQILIVKSSEKSFGALTFLSIIPFVFIVLNITNFESFFSIAVILFFVLIFVFVFLKSTKITMNKSTNKVTIEKISLFPNGNVKKECNLDHIIGARIVKNVSRGADRNKTITYGIQIDTKDNLDIPPLIDPSSRSSKEKIKNEINEWLEK